MRISQGPHAALSVAESASADQVRAAFLDLTKQFHPARFGRMSSDILRLANEVFLGIKGAHDQLMRTLGVPRHMARGSNAAPVAPSTSGATQRGFAPVPPGTQPGVRTTDPRGIDRGTDRPGIDRGTDRPGIDRGTDRPGIDRGTDRTLARPSTPVMKTPSVGTPRPPSPTGVHRPGTPRTGTPPPGEPPPRSSSSAIETPDRRTTPSGVPAPTRPTTPGGVPAPTRPTTPLGASRLGTPPGQRPATPPSESTVRFGTAPPARAATVHDEESMLKQAMDLLSTKDWSGARLAFHALAAKVPQARNYRALLCYARGRETAATGRVDDAVMEFQRALQLDPDLEIAKAAIREVQRKSP